MATPKPLDFVIELVTGRWVKTKMPPDMRRGLCIGDEALLWQHLQQEQEFRRQAEVRAENLQMELDKFVMPAEEPPLDVPPPRMPEEEPAVTTENAPAPVKPKRKHRATKAGAFRKAAPAEEVAP